MEYKEILVETTGGEFPAHTYYINETGKLAAFKREGETEVTVFKKPMMFDKKRRTFKKLKK